jgi:hypothetical protein
MSELVDRFRRARNVTDFNRARIDLQRVGTPAEVIEVHNMSRQLPSEVTQWIARLHDYCFWERPGPSDHIRVTEDPEWTYFQRPEGAAGRELVIGFTGAAANLFQPSPVVLQQLDAKNHDLLLLRDLRRSGYRDGIADVTSFDGLLDKIRTVAARYQSLVVIGGSMGGAPAVFAGIHLGARRSISVGGSIKNIDAARRYLDALPSGSRTDRSECSLVCLFADGAERDRDGAKAIRDAVRDLAGEDVLTVGVAGTADHSLPHACFQRGTLAPLYSFILNGETPTASEIHPASGETSLRLEPTCQPPLWAIPGAGPNVWLSNSPRIPDFLRLGVKRIKLPAWLATALEAFAYRRLGIAVHFRRNRRHIR